MKKRFEYEKKKERITNKIKSYWLVDWLAGFCDDDGDMYVIESTSNSSTTILPSIHIPAQQAKGKSTNTHASFFSTQLHTFIDM